MLQDPEQNIKILQALDMLRQNKEWHRVKPTHTSKTVKQGKLVVDEL